MPITICDSPETLRSEIDLARKKVTLDETEETWDTIAQGILHLTRLCNNGGCQFPSDLVAGIRSISRPLSSALNTERSRLSGAAVELITALATGLGPSFEPLVSLFVPTLLGLCGRTNKVFTSRARACIFAIIQHTQLPSLLPYLADLANHKSVFPRLTAAEGILACLNCFNPPDLEKETRARIVEDFIKSTARDANADVRKASKEVFKAYKTLMPARVASFVAPLTPVVKKYLDIQTGPNSGAHTATSNAGQRQTSRPSSRANNMVTERPASSTLPKPPPRPTPADLAHSTKQRPAVRGCPTAVDARGPRQRTVSQMQRDPPPRALHINTQTSSTAQRCVVPTSAPARQTVHPAPGVARVPPAPGASSSKGPQRPPPPQMKINPSSDRLKVTGNGAQRIPLPSVPVNGQPSAQAPVIANRTGGSTDEHEPRSKLPSRNAEVAGSGKLPLSRKAPEGSRSASASTNPARGLSAPTVPVVVQRSSKLPVKDKVKASGTAPRQQPATNVKKDTRPLVKAERKETSPTLIPLPPSRPASPREIPLPGSPDSTPRPIEAREEAVVAPLSESPSSTPQPRFAEPCQEQVDMPPSTPITALLASIQRGFLFTPSSPLSPPQNYLPAPGNLLERRQGTMKMGDLTMGPLAGAAFCVSLEDNAIADGLDRHALKNLN